MEEGQDGRNPKPSSVRWDILRQALLRRHRRPHPNNSEEQSDQKAIKLISRRASHGFGLIPSTQVVDRNDDKDPNLRDVRFCYTLPVDGAPKLILKQRVDNGAELSDFEVSNRYNIDNTGLVCQWPSEDVLAYFCLSHADMFRSKRIIELGSGYGLAGLVIAATTEVSEVVISDGNPQVVDYIQQNIDANFGTFGDTKVKAMVLHWDQEKSSNCRDSFDFVVASDCTFFKEFHEGLAFTIKLLLRSDGPSEAIFFSPKRGDSLDKFLKKIGENGLRFFITENYDTQVWKRHLLLMDGDNSWPSYDKDHCYPLLPQSYLKALGYGRPRVNKDLILKNDWAIAKLVDALWTADDGSGEINGPIHVSEAMNMQCLRGEMNLAQLLSFYKELFPCGLCI